MKERKELESKKKIQAVCDIYHNEESVVMTLEMPGVTKDSLDIKVDKNKLIIYGKRTNHPVNGDYLIREILDSDFYQEFTIDDTIDVENINAKIDNGIVTVTLGIKETAKARTIEIQTR